MAPFSDAENATIEILLSRVSANAAASINCNFRWIASS